MHDSIFSIAAGTPASPPLILPHPGGGNVRQWMTLWFCSDSIDLSLLVDVRAVLPCYPVRQLGDSYPVRRWLDGLQSDPAMAGQENPQPSGEALQLEGNEETAGLLVVWAQLPSSPPRTGWIQLAVALAGEVAVQTDVMHAA